MKSENTSLELRQVTMEMLNLDYLRINLKLLGRKKEGEEVKTTTHKLIKNFK